MQSGTQTPKRKSLRGSSAIVLLEMKQRLARIAVMSKYLSMVVRVVIEFVFSLTPVRPLTLTLSLMSTSGRGDEYRRHVVGDQLTALTLQRGLGRWLIHYQRELPWLGRLR